MGTRLTTQKRGRGSPRYRTPGHHFYGDVSYSDLENSTGQVIELQSDPGRHAIVAIVLLDDGVSTVRIIAPEGLSIGAKLNFRSDRTFEVKEEYDYDYSLITPGSVLPLYRIPDGAQVFNLERHPFDGGKMGRTSGASILVVGRDEETGMVTVKLSSRRLVVFDPRCRATIGVAASGGRTEKPFKKAGYKSFAMKARNRMWPRVRGTAMSAYDHPHGGKSFGKASTVGRNTPPGRKVGLIAASRTGRRRGKRVKSEDSAQ